jgi:hypothetical protein
MPMAVTGSRTTPDRATHRYTIEHNDDSTGTQSPGPTGNGTPNGLAAF